MHRTTLALAPLIALALLLALAAPAAADEPTPVVVPFNADDDNRDGVRDADGPPVEGDDDVAVVWRSDTPFTTIDLATGAPDGSFRFRFAEDRRSAAVEALRPIGADWDGRFDVHVTADNVATTVPCRVAPLVVRSSLAPARTVLVRELPGRNERFVEQLRAVCREAEIELHAVPAGDPYAYNHVWLQDTVEFLESAGDGRTTAPLTVALAGVRDRRLDHVARDRLLGPGLGWVVAGAYRERFARGEGGVSWIDWYGNLEASPPTDAHPRGRVLYGVDARRDAQLHPDVVAFLGAQGVQPPLAVDVGWLTIKHVDETVSFLPTTGNEGGFVLAVPNPLVAISTLKRLDRQGHGETPLLGVYEEGLTVAGLLADGEFVRANERLYLRRIEPMARRLAREIGADPDAVVGLPVLFTPAGLPRTPNVVNCLVLPGRDGGGGHVVMADPNGPVVDGEDVFRQEVRRRLGAVAAKLHFVDDRQYHKWSGNVHCATNAVRPLGE